MLLSELAWEHMLHKHPVEPKETPWDVAVIPGDVCVYRGRPEHESMAGLYQITPNKAPFDVPPAGKCWDALTTQCWLIEYMRWWNANHPGG